MSTTRQHPLGYLTFFGLTLKHRCAAVPTRSNPEKELCRSYNPSQITDVEFHAFEARIDAALKAGDSIELEKAVGEYLHKLACRYHRGGVIVDLAVYRSLFMLSSKKHVAYGGDNMPGSKALAPVPALSKVAVPPKRKKEDVGNLTDNMPSSKRKRAVDDINSISTDRATKRPWRSQSIESNSSSSSSSSSSHANSDPMILSGRASRTLSMVSSQDGATIPKQDQKIPHNNKYLADLLSTLIGDPQNNLDMVRAAKRNDSTNNNQHGEDLEHYHQQLGSSNNCVMKQFQNHHSADATRQ